MNKYIKIAVISSLLASAGFVYAQTNLQNLGERRQARVQESMQRIEELRENLQERISNIKDEAKQNAANKISSQFDRINNNWTNHFTNVLDRLDAILAKIKLRRDKALANGQNVSAADVAILEAQEAINSARTAVELQAQKTYVVDVSSIASTTDQNSLVSQFRAKFKEMRDIMFADLTSLRDGAMKNARSAVQASFQALVQIPNVDEEPETNQ